MVAVPNIVYNVNIELLVLFLCLHRVTPAAACNTFAYGVRKRLARLVVCLVHIHPRPSSSRQVFPDVVRHDVRACCVLLCGAAAFRCTCLIGLSRNIDVRTRLRNQHTHRCIKSSGNKLQDRISAFFATADTSSFGLVLVAQSKL